MDLSEFSTAPRRILIHDPADGAALGAMTGDRLGDCNFLDLPAAERFTEEYRGLRAALAEAAEVVTLADLLGDDQLRVEVGELLAGVDQSQSREHLQARAAHKTRWHARGYATWSRALAYSRCQYLKAAKPRLGGPKRGAGTTAVE